MATPFPNGVRLQERAKRLSAGFFPPTMLDTCWPPPYTTPVPFTWDQNSVNKSGTANPFRGGRV
jgi:hypothetical protein